MRERERDWMRERESERERSDERERERERSAERERFSVLPGYLSGFCSEHLIHDYN